MRHKFGGSPADFAVEKVGNQLLLRPGATGAAWTAATGGSQYTDLTDLAGNPISQITADSDGSVAFMGPDNVTTCYVDFGYGRRYCLTAVDTGQILADHLAKGGQADGWAQLDGAGKVKTDQLPAGSAGGTQGPPGDPGAPGSQVLTGTAAPTAGLGVNGDLYIQEDTRTFLGVTSTTLTYYRKASGAWTQIGAPTGGSKWYVNDATTAATDTKPGDMLLRIDSGSVFQRTATGWGSSLGSLKGAKGDPGPKGSTWYQSSTATPDYGNVASPAVGDMFLYPSSGDLFRYSGTAWDYAGSIKGPKGDSGSSSSSALVLGTYVPNGWGKYWRAALAKAGAGTGLARMVCVGGSATLGYYASNPRTKSWPGLVASSLQATYGDGGSGFHGVSLSNTLAGDSPAAYTAWTTAGAAVTQTGTWTQGGSTYGPGGTYIYSDKTGDTLTFKARGTTVKIYTVTGSGTRPAMLYSIDGGADVSVPQPSGTAAIQTTTVTGLSNTEHTVRVKVGTTSTGQYLSVCGVSGERASGVVVHNCALGGATSARYNNDTAAALNAIWNGGSAFPADLAVYSAAPNDASTNITGDAWVTNLIGWIKAVRAAGAAGTGADILVALPHIGTHEGTNNKYWEYSRLARPLADVYGFALVNWWTDGQNSWDAWNKLSYWGTSATPGAAGTDGVHLSDVGFQHMADTLLPFIAS
ncbi:hypothetical protein ACIQMV_08895 [Streptomyces sp. NPDC091412]|uniref:hypothetical protein n=1 Tax=Streptomyces sp. NPDC091412 TaxID=3366002 RepID=UPI00380DD474